MAWVGDETRPGTTVAVIGYPADSGVVEWFPALSERTNVTTAQGSERAAEGYCWDEAQAGVRCRSIDCLPEADLYVLRPGCCPDLVASLEMVGPECLRQETVMFGDRRTILSAVGAGLTIAGLSYIALVWLGLAPYAQPVPDYGPMFDARGFWIAWQGGLYDIPWGEYEAFVYSPAFAQLLWPFTLLPWPVFAGLWTLAAIGCLFWMRVPWMLRPSPASSMTSCAATSTCFSPRRSCSGFDIREHGRSGS